MFEPKIQKLIPVILFLVILVFISYFNSLNNQFISDDIDSIAQNSSINNYHLVFKKSYIALQPLLYTTIFKLFGASPVAFRTANIFFHSLVVLTIYFLLSRLHSKNAAFFAASIFAVHPILTESVTWVSGGNYVRYSLLLLISLFFYTGSPKKIKYYLFSVFFFLLALFSSEKALVLPLILVLYEIVFSSIKKHWPRVIPFLGLMVFAAFFFSAKIMPRAADIKIQNGSGELYNPVLQIPTAITSYLTLFVWPNNLTLYHSEFVNSAAQQIVVMVILLVFIGGIVLTYRKNKPAFFWLGFFIISLLPTLTPFRIAWVVAERYVYLGTVALCTLVGFFLERLIKIKKYKIIGYIIYSVLIISFMLRTIIRNTDWKDQSTLWIATAKTSPSSAQNHNNLGDYHSRSNDFERALDEFKIAIELNPHYADAYHNAGLTLIKLKQYDEAEKYFKKAIKYNNGLWQSHQNLAAIYYREKKYDLARQHITKAIDINPGNLQLKQNLALIERALKADDHPL